MALPQDLMYTKTHEWVKWIDDTTAQIGLTEYAQNAMGDIVYVGLPEIGDHTTAEESFADVESVKAASDIFSPVTGNVSKTNEALIDAPESINENPYDTWLVVISQITEKIQLLTPVEYEALLAEEEQ